MEDMNWGQRTRLNNLSRSAKVEWRDTGDGMFLATRNGWHVWCGDYDSMVAYLSGRAHAYDGSDDVREYHGRGR